jgi:hypothetical protein
MKHTQLLTVFLSMAISYASFGQFEGSKQIFSSPKLQTEIQKHKMIAILPFQATITYKRPPKNFDAAANTAEEQKLATNMQQGMYTYLLRKSGSYSVSFQDIERTNALLKQKGLYDKISEVTQDSVCKALGVDAVIKSSYSFEKTSTEGGAIVKAVLFGSAFGKTANGLLTMQIYNGADGDLLWRFHKEMDESVMGSPNEVMERMMRKVARNFPYER